MRYHLRGTLDLLFLTSPAPAPPRQEVTRQVLASESQLWNEMDTANMPLPGRLFPRWTQRCSSHSLPMLCFPGFGPDHARRMQLRFLGAAGSSHITQCTCSLQLKMLLVGTSRAKSEPVFGSILESLCYSVFSFFFLFSSFSFFLSPFSFPFPINDIR